MVWVLKVPLKPREVALTPSKVNGVTRGGTDAPELLDRSSRIASCDGCCGSRPGAPFPYKPGPEPFVCDG